MSIQKPTADELKQWETALQDEGLGMDRATNTRRLVYGEKSLDMAPSWDDVRIYVKQKRKAHKVHKPHKPVLVAHCKTCGRSFIAKRKDAKFCKGWCRVKSSLSHNR